MSGHLAEITICGELEEESYQIIEAEIAQALADENCFALVLVFDSNGGDMSAAVPRIGDMLFKATKPVYGYVKDVCASAAYWIASQCRAGLSAYRAADIGSIGVFIAAWDKSAAAAAKGWAPVVVRSVPDKAVGLPGEVITDQTKAIVQKSVNDVDALFRADINRARPQVDLSKQTGLSYIASEALSLGLIDAVEDYSDFLNRLVEPAKAPL